ncbi:hypothetical protein FB45DRAFT_1053764 [Roridomyces roridus]|uniref:F-box domain-containing protein n=1 Tax=Roridomyces roridus TaxID=1738132 RepID=A0AAD7FV98_9AGAR|nr:hypothetical protein FB45DRAFT_1053764 [Roridomyces roridus]
MSYPDSKAAREADRARVVAVDTEVSELQERIRVLRMEQESCQRRLEAYKYPVLTLPNEITSEIFIHFLPPYPTCPQLRGLRSPTSLTHICRKWRDIALGTPKLWRAFSTAYRADQPEHIQAVQTWLERSGSCPLSVKLVLGNAPHDEALTAILLHRERWQHMELNLAANEVALIKGPMPLLQSLSLGVGDFEYTQPATTVDDFPRLRAVTLDDACHGNWLPISQLTSLTFDDVEPDNYLPLLQDAVNLVRLHLIDCDTDVLPPQCSVKLDRLETLVVVSTFSWDSGASQIFETFILPALRTLHVSGTFLGEDPRSIAPLLTRSRCKLQEVLVARECKFSETAFRAAFPSIPNIIFDGEYSWSARRHLRNAL